MIDVVILNINNNISKTLFSIYIQTIKNDLKIYVISRKKDKKIGPFKDKLNIEEIVVGDVSIGLMRSKGLNKCKNEYITFINSGDCFYNVFSLNNLFKIRDKNDIIFGKIVNYNIPYSNNYVEGNLYRKKFLDDNKIDFFDSNSADNGFNKLILMFNSNYTFSDDLIYYIENTNINYDIYFKEVIDDVIKCLKIADKNNCSNLLVSEVIYDCTVYLAYLYSLLGDKKRILKYIGKYYEYYLKYYEYVSYGVKNSVSKYYGKGIQYIETLIFNMFNDVK